MPIQRPFRFGTGAFPAASRNELISVARKIEDLGYSACFVPDHIQDLLSPSLALMMIAEATKTVRLSSYVFDNDFRHPALLANEIATLDLLTGGRVEFGIGAGWLSEDYALTGIPFDPPGVRVSRFAESVHILKRLLSGEKVTYTGEHYTLTDLKNFPPPTQLPHPPLMIGGGSKRMLSLAAREADIISVVMRTGGGRIDFTTSASAATAERIAWIREAAGERFDSLELNTLVFYVNVTEHRQQVANEIAGAWGLPAEYMLDSTHFLIGTVEQICEDILRWREQFGISYVTVFPEFTEIFAPVVARLAGR